MGHKWRPILSQSNLGYQELNSKSFTVLPTSHFAFIFLTQDKVFHPLLVIFLLLISNLILVYWGLRRHEA